MHDLEKLIADWRRSMRRKMSVDQIDELEDHLRERIAALMRDQLSFTDAFRKAVQDLGAQGDITAEYEKGNTFWFPFKVAVAVEALLVVAAVLLWIRLSNRPYGFLLGPHVFTITLGYVGTLLIGCLGISFVMQRSICDFTPTRAQSIASNTSTFAMIAASLTAIGFVLGMIWAKLAWGRYFAADPKEVGAIAVLAAQICLIAAHRAYVSPRAVMTIAIAGGIACACAWFGADIWMKRKSLHSWALWIIVIPHLIALFAAFLPSGWLAAGRDAKSSG